MLKQNVVYKFNNLKIQNKLIFLLVFLITVSLILMGFFSFNIASKIVNEKIEYNMKSSVNQIRYNLDVILSNMRSMVEVVYQDRPTQKFLAQNSDIYTRQQYNDIIMSKMTWYNAVASYLFSSDGRVYGYNMTYTDTDLNYKTLPEYKKSKESNRIVWISTNHVGIGSRLIPEDIKNRFGIAVTIKDFDSMNEVGFMEINFKESEIFNVYNKIKMTDNSYGFILDEDGNIVSHPIKSLLGTKSEFYPQLKNKVYNSLNGSFSFRDNNASYLVIYDTLQANGWKLVFILPNKDLVKDIDLIRNTFLVIVIIGSLISVLLALVISRSISRPISDIISVMTRFGKGDLSARIEKYNNRTDEVGVLANEFNSMIKQINLLIKNNYHNEIKKKEAEMEALQAQINPHFLYNTLDSINFIARKYKVDEISRMVIALGDLMRISIRKDFYVITVRDEVNYIQNYMTIQSIRYKDKFSLEINIDNDVYDVMIPKLILQPIIENALVHGIEEKVGKGTIRLNGYKIANNLVFEVIDDGVGMEESVVNEMLKNNILEYENMTEKGLIVENLGNNKKKGSNIGLLNVDMRLKIAFGKEFGLSVQSKIGEGTKVTVRLPLRKQL